MEILTKLQSRKLWVTIGVVLLLAFGVEVPQEIVAALGGAYVLGQSYVDGQAAKKG